MYPLWVGLFDLRNGNVTGLLASIGYAGCCLAYCLVGVLPLGWVFRVQKWRCSRGRVESNWDAIGGCL